MSKISIIKIELDGDRTHQTFQWQSNKYEKLTAVFCSPETQLSLAFDNGKKVAIKSLNYEGTLRVPPNGRVFYINKELNNELILGVLSIFAKKNASVYFLLEK